MLLLLAVICVIVLSVFIFVKCPRHCLVDFVTYDEEKKLLQKACAEESFDLEEYYKQRELQLTRQKKDTIPLQLLVQEKKRKSGSSVSVLHWCLKAKVKNQTCGTFAV